MRKKKSGFTLIEMLVVVSVIGIMSFVGIVSYSQAIKKSRDGRRKADLKNIQGALEMYYSSCGFIYPTNLASGIVCPTGNQTILNPLPVDPKDSSAYPRPTLSETSYQVCTNSLEAESPTGYCVKNQQ